MSLGKELCSVTRNGTSSTVCGMRFRTEPCDSLQLFQVGDEEAQSLQRTNGVCQVPLGVVQLLDVTGDLLHLHSHRRWRIHGFISLCRFDRHTDRHRHRHRQADRHRHRHRHRQTDRHRQTHRPTDRQTDRQTDTQIHI